MGNSSPILVHCRWSLSPLTCARTVVGLRVRVVARPGIPDYCLVPYSVARTQTLAESAHGHNSPLSPPPPPPPSTSSSSNYSPPSPLNLNLLTRNNRGRRPHAPTDTRIHYCYYTERALKMRNDYDTCCLSGKVTDKDETVTRH